MLTLEILLWIQEQPDIGKKQAKRSYWTETGEKFKKGRRPCQFLFNGEKPLCLIKKERILFMLTLRDSTKFNMVNFII